MFDASPESLSQETPPEDAPPEPAWLAELPMDAVAPFDPDVEPGLMSAAERFEHEYGLPAVPGLAAADAATTEQAAALLQDLAVQAARMQTIAEAHRISGLLQAYEASMEDLEVRFDRQVGSRGGLGAQAFFRTMGLLTRSHPFRIAHEVDTAGLLRDRLPATWEAFRHGDASWARVDAAARAADGLDDEHLAAFDETAARAVVRSSRLKDDLRKARERLQDGTAARRARSTHERRTTALEPGPDGGAALVVSGLAADRLPIAGALQRAAVAAHGVAGETRSVAALRHDIVRDVLHAGLLGPADAGAAVPGRRPVDVALVLTVPALAWPGRTTEQARLEGYGPIDLETAKALAGTAASFVRVLTDPVTGARLAMDRTARTPPVDLARRVRLRDGRSRFPGATAPAHLCDIDHAREWQHGGPTDAANLVVLDRATHLLKSAALLQEHLRDDGVVDRIDAWGHRFEDPPPEPADPAPPEGDPEREAPCPF